jgi:Fur family ferric uptake transcriptional regulator
MMSEKLTALSEILREKGYRLTAARRLILAVLTRSGGHVTADGLAEMVRLKSPTVGRMTVYRTLDLLCQLGLIRPVYQGTAAAHYVLMNNGHHQHLVCSDCGMVIEVEERVLEEIGQVFGSRFQFKIQGHLLEFYGLCRECQR